MGLRDLEMVDTGIINHDQDSHKRLDGDTLVFHSSEHKVCLDEGRTEHPKALMVSSVSAVSIEQRFSTADFLTNHLPVVVVAKGYSAKDRTVSNCSVVLHLAKARYRNSTFTIRD